MWGQALQHARSVINLQESLLRAIARLMAEVAKSPPLAAERDAARAEFFGDREPDATGKARFEEWFLFERRSPRLGEVPPILSLASAIEGELAPDGRDLLDESGANQYGVFEREEREGETLGAIRDLLSGRVLTLEPEEAEALQGGLDERCVLVGRLFPSGRGTYFFGRGAMAVGGEIAEALRGDLARREVDRKARLSQIQMERLLFSPDGAAAAPEPTDPTPREGTEHVEILEAEIAQWLRDARLEGFDLDEIRERFRRAEAMREAIEPLLDEVAFESEADLEVGRRLLPAYYRALRANATAVSGASNRATGSAPDALRARAESPCPCRSGRAYGDCCLPKDALARFEAGRARGESLDQLIGDLEAAMGIEGEDEDDQEWGGADAPPLGPMVDEYLWECERLGEARGSEEAAFLRALARSVDAADGAPGDLSQVVGAHFERFLFFDRYREAAAPRPGSAARDLDSLLRFANWVRDEQGVDWNEMLAPLCAREANSGARLAPLNEALGTSDVRGWKGVFAVTRLARRGAVCEVELESVGLPVVRASVDLSEDVARHLEPGDCIVVSEGAESLQRGERKPGRAESHTERRVEARLLRVLPAGARPFLSAKERSTPGR